MYMCRCITIQFSSATIKMSHLHHLHSISCSSWHTLHLGRRQWAVGGGGGEGEGGNLWLLRLDGSRHLDSQRYSSNLLLHAQEEWLPLLAFQQPRPPPTSPMKEKERSF